ncbi:hypothetical protein [Priestia aryabhattai]|uniref:hypothetical protein n=1 Tax=Priestia aryabhattai TaxID=412384 RepID=UPI002E1CDF54|nr:hypothetical protein [Priestia aryabhattai]
MCAKRIRKGAKVTQINLKEAKEKIIKIKTLEGMAQSTLNQYNLVFNDLITFFESSKQVLLPFLECNTSKTFCMQMFE